MDGQLKRSPGIYLAGFMACGKSTIGRQLAERLGWDFVDLDQQIAAAAGKSIEQIFDTGGEAAFRRLEIEAMRNLMRAIERGMPTVIALGGGTFVQREIRELLTHHGVSIWLDCPLETLLRRVSEAGAGRPLARDPEVFRRLYEERRAGYALANYRIEADCTVHEAVDRILALPFWK